MKQLIIFILFALISINTYAQATLYVGEDFMNRYRNVKINTSKNKPGENISGSPFTTDDFVLGTVIGYKANYLLRYDTFNDQMLVKRKDGNVVIVDKETITEATFNDGTKYKVFDYIFDGTKRNGYLEVLLENSAISLLKKEVIKFVPAQKPASGYDQPKPPMFKKARDQYFILNKKGEINLFSKKKDILMLFPDIKNDIDSFIKSNKIKFTKEKDLIKLVEHINSSL
ncbi:MAG: hypothetical protein OEW87_02800 [Flavobacteriaceae bacterium]|nr:hypothetical protein [Flavobacteriaceae bacterium]